ncbi:MAG: 16S rRNA (adenine(1518)-N(6)/adenine(1519)-N(6))-dimethyltransferase RsmA [Candidatus Thorarchaeota archaeon]
MSNLIPSIRDALNEAGISPRKILSQNFLINNDILNRQIEYAQITANETVLEIGGGTGILTEILAKHSKKVFCIEYDRELASYLRKKFSNQKKVEIIEGDVLKINLPKTDKIVANLPYHISSPITFKLLEIGFKTAVLMYQLEFAKRMIAEPKSDDYSRLSVNLQLQAEVEILEKISRNNFYPPPKVDSAIVKITPKNLDFPFDVKNFRVVTRILFNTKNKIVSSIFYEFLKRDIDKDERFTFKKELDASLTHANSRVRELVIDDFIVITQELVSFLEKKGLLSLFPDK